MSRLRTIWENVQAIRRSWGAPVRAALLFLVLIGAIGYFAQTVHGHYPIDEWLFWLYARIWAWVALFAVACLSVGNLAVTALRLTTLGLRERLIFAFAFGVLGFYLAMFLGGIMGLYGPRFAVAMPFMLLAAGAMPLVQLLRRARRHLRAARRRRRPEPLRWWMPLALALGMGSVALVYFALLSPANVAFDSKFYHLGWAQELAVVGRIRPSSVGWLPAALPQLAGTTYAWMFLVPGFDLFGRTVGAAHLEFLAFLVTLASIPVLVRWLVPGARVGLSWVCLFLFPGILVYDSMLSVSADHITAMWAIPIFLALRSAFRALETRHLVTLAVMMGAAVLTKYQAIYLGAFPILAIAARVPWLAIRGRMTKAPPAPRLMGMATSLAIAVGAGLVVTAPLWLKNWLFYDDPMFPLLLEPLGVTRWGEDAPELVRTWQDWQLRRWRPDGETTDQLVELAKVLVTFSFVPHDWPISHRDVPVFGSLFTLLTASLVFLRGTKRTWGLVVATHLGVAIWFMTNHQDRYLQVLLPWMAATVAAALVLLWRVNWMIRGAAIVLVALQVVWGADGYFIRSHAMTRRAPAEPVLALLRQGFERKYEERFRLPGHVARVGAVLPADAGVLLHEHNPRLGIWRPIVSDIAGWQLGLRYDQLEGSRAVHVRLKELGITHIVTRRATSRGIDSLGADLRFFGFVTRHTKRTHMVGKFGVYELLDEPPAQNEEDEQVAYLACGRTYQRGLHPLSTMTVRETQLGRAAPRVAASEPVAPKDANVRELLERADYAVVNDKCRHKVPKEWLTSYELLASHGAERRLMKKPE